ncbi:conserved Plasmodium protein, unknown function [Plasmodium malariae]|uniref:CID domain-containing protein n=1 Tax=Plasmodium malariae TaxID=5858 RepID=A0A1C3KD34_PLAMA|nr:conserved Plasmodium protein, unknown function [Plasmodium malariae]
MKYEKKFWNNDKGKKKRNEKNLKDDNYNRGHNKKYNNYEGVGYNKSCNHLLHNNGMLKNMAHSERTNTDMLHNDLLHDNTLQNDLLHNNRSKNNKPHHSKYNSEKSSYTPFPQNLKKYNNYEIKNKMLDKRNNKNNNEHMLASSSYRKGAMNQKMHISNNMKSNHSRYQKTYPRVSTHRTSKFSVRGDNYNLNNFDGNKNIESCDISDDYINQDNYNVEDNYRYSDNNDKNYGSNYGGNYSSNCNDNSNDSSNGNSSNKYGRTFRNEDIHIELSNMHRDLHNMLFSASKLSEENSLDANNWERNNSEGANFEETNPNSNSNSNDDFKTSFSNFFNSYQMNVKNSRNSKYNDNNKIESSKNKESNDSVLSKLLVLRNIPFNSVNTDNSNDNSNNEIADKRSNNISGNDIDSASGNVSGLVGGNSNGEHKVSSNSKTAMIINDLKKCLNSNSESNMYTPNDNMLQSLSFDNNRVGYDKDSVNNYYLDNDHFDANKSTGGIKSVDESISSRNNSFLSQHMYANIKENCMEGGNEEIEHKTNRYKYMNNDYKFVQESPISNNSANGGNGDSSESNSSSSICGVMEANAYRMKEEKITFNNNNLFPRTQIEESLKVLNTLQVDIERVCCYIKHFIDPPEQLFEVMVNSFVNRSVLINSKIAIFYVYNHLIQELRNNYKNDFIRYNTIAEKGLEIFVIPVLRHILSEEGNSEMINKIYRCISIWNERNIYSKIICDQLKALQKNPHKKIDLSLKHTASQAHSLLSNELSKFVPVNFILKMPSINNEHKKALEDKILNALFLNLSKDTLKEFPSKDIEEASKTSDKVMRIFGQELILINSQILELSSLISDNNEHLVKLQTAMERLYE